MPRSPAPPIEVEQCHAALRVADLLAAIEFYTTRLGFQHAFTWGEPPTMAGVNLGETQIFLEPGTPAPQSCSLYFVVGNADELHEFHRTQSVEILETLGDREWGLRDYTVRDVDGYALTFGHRLQPTEPPLRGDVSPTGACVHSASLDVGAATVTAGATRGAVGTARVHGRSLDDEIGPPSDDLGSTRTALRSADADISPLAVDVRSTNPDVRSTNPDVRSTNSDVSPANPDVRSTNSDVRSTNSDVSSTNSDVSSTNSDVRSANPDVRSTNPDVRSANPDLRPVDSDVRPADSDVRPRATTSGQTRTICEQPTTISEPPTTICEQREPICEPSRTICGRQTTTWNWCRTLSDEPRLTPGPRTAIAEPLNTTELTRSR